MNKKRVILSLVIIIFIIGGFLLANFIRKPVSTSFATGVILRYKYLDHDINEIITDLETIKELTGIMSGRVYTDNPSCGFTADISITFFNEEKTLMICPALDGDPIMRVGDNSNEYFKITDQARAELDIMLHRYGFKFPAV